MRCAGAGISTLGVKSRSFGGRKKQTAKLTEWNFSPSRFSFAQHLAIREAAPPARPREDPAILLPMDPLFRPISDSQPRLVPLCVPPRGAETLHPLICNNRTRSQKPGERTSGGGGGGGDGGGGLLQRPPAKSGVGSWRKGGQKLRNMNPLNNQRSKSICSTSEGGERTTEECAEWAVAERPSKPVSQANTQQPGWRRGGMAARDGAE